MDFAREIALKNITFAYGSTNTKVLRDINLTIPVKTLVGFAGKTGSGKTTLVDIILGLLIPQDGAICIDDVNVTAENIRNWQQNLGYVPQTIYLSNDTIASNIAFGQRCGKNGPD
jgi:ATP-binding cassette subfamily C protein